MKARSGWMGIVLGLLLAAPPAAAAPDSDGGTGPPQEKASETTTARDEAAVEESAGTQAAAPLPNRTDWFLGMGSELTRIRDDANHLRLRVGRLDTTAQAVMSQRLDDILSRDETLSLDLMLLEQMPRGAWLSQREGFEAQVEDLRAELEAYEATLTQWGA